MLRRPIRNASRGPLCPRCTKQSAVQPERGGGLKLGITIPSRTAQLSRIPDYARMAGEAGFDSVWTYELYRNPFAMLCTSALTTSNAELCTGLATALNRSPFEAANAAADVDELSGSRMKLGPGTGVPEFLKAFHSTDFKSPIKRLSDYLEALRHSWAYLAGEEAEPFNGTHYQFAAPRFNPWGLRKMVRPQIPILLAGMRPQVLKLCWPKADGWIGYLWTAKFFDQVVLPNIADGARSAGCDPDGFGHLLGAPRPRHRIGTRQEVRRVLYHLPGLGCGRRNRRRAGTGQLLARVDDAEGAGGLRRHPRRACRDVLYHRHTGGVSPKAGQLQRLTACRLAHALRASAYR